MDVPLRWIISDGRTINKATRQLILASNGDVSSIATRPGNGDFSAPAWFTEGQGEHSVAHQRAECERHLAAGGIALGAFANAQLVGIGIVRPHIRPEIAQFAFLYVSNGHRAQGIGRHLSEELERLAREGGDTTMVVSATPSLNTVRFYLHRGFEPTAEPLPELYELEPEDVHLQKRV